MHEDDETKKTDDGVSRRTFVRSAAIAGAGLTIVPRHVLGRGFQAPSDTVNIATVGIGGMGGSNTRSLMSQNIVAICDVRPGTARTTARRLQAGPRRRMQAARRQPRASSGAQRKRSSDANARRPAQNNAEQICTRFVDVAAPEAEALPRLPRDARQAERHRRGGRRDARITCTRDRVGGDGRRQARLRAEAAVLVGAGGAPPGARRRRTTEGRHADGQPGPLDDDGAAARYEYITGGAIGDIREVHVWTNRPLGYWPQGVPRPAPLRRPIGSGSWLERTGRRRHGSPRRCRQLPGARQACLGSVPRRGAGVEYHPLYHPFNWRGWVDWGQGALGDMGAHLIDHPFWALELGLPTVDRDAVDAVQRRLPIPHATTTYYEFAGARQHAGGDS